MSFTAVYTPLYPQDALDDDDTYIDYARNAYDAGVKILDYDGLTDALRDQMVDQMDTETRTDDDQYPAQQWQYLMGFSTWGGSDDDHDATYHNIERLGFHYDPDDAERFWSTVSEYTEPFVCWSSPQEHDFPHALDVVTASSGATVLRIEGADGELTVEELTLDVVDRSRFN